MSSPAYGSPEWSAAKDFAMLMLLTGGDRLAAQELWLRKVRIHLEAPQVRVQVLPRQPSRSRAADRSRLRLGHRPCPSRGRPPSSLATSAARSSCARSTSPARCGPACASPAGCWRGRSEFVQLSDPKLRVRSVFERTTTPYQSVFEASPTTTRPNHRPKSSRAPPSNGRRDQIRAPLAAQHLGPAWV